MGAPAPAGRNHSRARPDLRVSELILGYFRHVERYYVKDGQPTTEVGVIRQALKVVRELYGHTLAKDFGPLALKACQDAMVARGWSRKSINRQIGRVRKMFSWAAGNEILPATIHQVLQTTEVGSARGDRRPRRTRRSFPRPTMPSSGLLGHLPPTVAAMVRVQRLTGMRPQEVVGLRAIDIDMGDPACWVYRPDRHKSEHHERERIAFIGPARPSRS